MLLKYYLSFMQVTITTIIHITNQFITFQFFSNKVCNLNIKNKIYRTDI